MKLTLPYPPTANLYWRVFRGRVVKSALARSYQMLAGVEARMAVRAQRKAGNPEVLPIPGPVHVTVRAYRPRRSGDLDNTLKIALDSFKGVLWADDSQVVRIEAERYDDKANPRLELEVRAIGAKEAA